MDIHKLGIIGAGEACDYLNVGHAAFTKLVRNYKIPHVKIRSGKVFLKSDIEAFQESRKSKLKYRADCYSKKKN